MVSECYQVCLIIVCVISVAVRALGDKSELPLLVATPSLMNSARDSTSAVDGNMQDCAVESELSELAINTVSSAEDSREAGITSPDIVSSDTECGNVADAANHSDSVAETNAAVELDAEDGAAASSSNYRAGADSTTNGADVGSDSKGETNCVFTWFLIRISVYLPDISFW